MPDYSKSKIYKLTCDDPGLIYYGSTTKNYLSDRLGQHNWDYRNNNIKSAKPLYEKGGVKIELIENYPCETKEELREREDYYIKNNQCVNKWGAVADPDYKKKWSENNKEYFKNRYEKKKEEIKKYRREKIECDGCGKIMQRCSIWKHKKFVCKAEA